MSAHGYTFQCAYQDGECVPQKARVNVTWGTWWLPSWSTKTRVFFSRQNDRTAADSPPPEPLLRLPGSGPYVVAILRVMQESVMGSHAHNSLDKSLLQKGRPFAGTQRGLKRITFKFSSHPLERYSLQCIHLFAPRYSRHFHPFPRHSPPSCCP